MRGFPFDDPRGGAVSFAQKIRERLGLTRRKRKIQSDLGFHFYSDATHDVRLEPPLPHRCGCCLRQSWISTDHLDSLHCPFPADAHVKQDRSLDALRQRLLGIVWFHAPYQESLRGIG